MCIRDSSRVGREHTHGPVALQLALSEQGQCPPCPIALMPCSAHALHTSSAGMACRRDRRQRSRWHGRRMRRTHTKHPAGASPCRALHSTHGALFCSVALFRRCCPLPRLGFSSRRSWEAHVGSSYSYHIPPHSGKGMLLCRRSHAQPQHRHSCREMWPQLVDV